MKTTQEFDPLHQNKVIVTQIITRATITITAIITLGQEDPTSTIQSTTSTASIPAGAPPIMAPAPNADLSSEQLGAILGSVLGFAGLVMLLCCCLALQRKRRLRTERTTTRVVYTNGYYSQSDSTFSGSGETDRAVRYTRRMSQRYVDPRLQQQQQQQFWGMPARRTDAGFTTVPQPVRFPPTPRYTNYVQTPYPQISGVQRYP
ncbi:hypothetical protein QBC38DRAFT_253970 [Podospora fimiseda]|uniref:Uncharacterized protein n=1 Tax=Podospora fimiseda TaxID=252190 RepID=A0AAN7BL79_9PEZI|nr:hypothetical protein QBC38DRAFT_253970 [Podospora fimiseda]